MLKFILISYLIGGFFQVLFATNPEQKYWLIFSMWAPTLAVLFSGKDARRSILDSISKRGLKYFPIAFVIGFSPYFVIQVFLYFSDMGSVDPEKEISMIPIVLLINPLATGLFGALGEEIGWRGFLQKKLEEKWGVIRASLILGIVWAFWHIPANLAGHNGAENPILNTFIIFPITVIGMTFAFSWLRNKSESIWPCVYLHGVINTVSNFWLIKSERELLEKLLILILWVFVGAIFLYMFKREGRARE